MRMSWSRTTMRSSCWLVVMASNTEALLFASKAVNFTTKWSGCLLAAYTPARKKHLRPNTPPTHADTRSFRSFPFELAFKISFFALPYLDMEEELSVCLSSLSALGSFLLSSIVAGRQHLSLCRPNGPRPKLEMFCRSVPEHLQAAAKFWCQSRHEAENRLKICSATPLRPWPCELGLAIFFFKSALLKRSGRGNAHGKLGKLLPQSCNTTVTTQSRGVAG